MCFQGQTLIKELTNLSEYSFVVVVTRKKQSQA